jgi:iron complex outermembrane receptor protein
MANADDQGFEALFDLSLEQLSSISVQGAAVRSLNLILAPNTNNPHQLENRYLSSTIEVIDHKTIEARGLKNVVQVVESMVGVLSGESPSEPYSFSTRGFSRNSINVLYDGISMGVSTLNMRPQNTFNLERVEVVKGASSLSNEEGAAGGSVNMISKKPKLGQPKTLDVLISYGRFNTSSVNMGLSGSSAANSAYRLDVNNNASDGWVDDTGSNSFNTTASYLFSPVSNVKLLASANYLKDSLPAYWGTPLIPASQAAEPDTSVVSTGDDRVVDNATRYNNYNVADNAIDSTSLWTRLDMSWQVSADTEIEATIYQFQADRLWQNAESYNFSTVTNDIRRDRLLVTHDRHIRGFTFAFNHSFGPENFKQSMSLKIESSVNHFTREIGFDLAADDFYDIDAVSIIDPVAGTFGAVDKRQDKQTRILDAIIYEHNWRINGDLFVDVGLRSEQIRFDKLYIQFDESIRQRKSLNSSINQNSYRIGVLYRLSDQHNVYSHYAMKHDPIEEDLRFFYDVANFESSDVYQWEVGLKSLFNQKQTELTLALYDIEKQGQFQASAGDALSDSLHTSQGLELAVKHEFSSKFRLGSSLAYTDVKYGGRYDADVGEDVSGKKPVNVPESMFSLWGSYSQLFSLPIETGFGFNHVDKRYADGQNMTELKAYQLLNAFVAYEASQYRLSFNVRNITDELYASWSDVIYANQVVLGAPRSYDLSFRARF